MITTKKIKIILKTVAIIIVVVVTQSYCRANSEQANKRTNTYDENSKSECIVVPAPYDRALKNPMKGFSPNDLKNHPWGTLSTFKFPWTKLENHESDGIEKIIDASNDMWGDAAEKNMKVIPHIYLHWSGDKKFWPSDMQEDDYTSEQFKRRVVRLIERLGICWDNDPRIAFIEMAIFGKWGEQHSPAPTPEMQKIVGDAFAKAFKNKKVSVRHNWREFTDYPFGEYWASWAHYDQMYTHGNNINKVNKEDDRYKENYLGGEVAYNWGNWKIQPGESPTESVADSHHRDFVINSIRWLHCTHLRWIDNYDRTNPAAVAGAEEMQKAFGYRYILNRVKFSLNDSLHVSFDVTNTGSAPFYYEWPVEVALLDTESLKPVWKSKMDSVDIRKWLPGENWTDPEWTPTGTWTQYHPDVNWNSSEEIGWSVPPAVNRIEDRFKIDVPDGNYILSLAILDPAGEVPAIRFATANYITGGRHPVGLVSVGDNTCSPLPDDFQFDDPYFDNTLTYNDNFEIAYTPEPKQTPFEGRAWRIPEDTVFAWQYDYMHYDKGNKYFALDSASTIGIYGSNDTTGQNIRNYEDSILNDNAAWFLWDPIAETFQKNGQWAEYTVNFMIEQPYQLRIRVRTETNAHFRLKIYSPLGDTILSKDLSLEEDFENLGGANTETDWLLSKFAVKDLWGKYIVRFDWYDNIGEPGVFGAFSFIKSNMDVTPPEWYFVSVGTIERGTDISVMTTEDAKVYLVPDGTVPDTTSIMGAAVASVSVTAYSQAKLATSALPPRNYVVYAIDSSNNISEASKLITLQIPVNAEIIADDSEISISYNPVNKKIIVKSTLELKQIDVYSILGEKIQSEVCDNTIHESSAVGLSNGIYLFKAVDVKGNYKKTKICVL